MLVVFTARSRFGDPDMWWHLKTGELIWTTHSIPRVDPFSFTATGHPWTAQEWLSEITIYLAYRLGGYTGLMLWTCVVASLLLIAGYVLCSFYSGNRKSAFLGAMGIWLFSTLGLVTRPHLIGYLLLVCELLFLQLGRTRDTRWYFALPPLFALWINFHSSFIFGLAVLAICFACARVNFSCGLLVSHRARKEAWSRLALSSAFCGAALFINPVGPALIWYPLDVMLNQPLNIASVSEWQPLPFSDVRAWALVGVSGLILLVPILRGVALRLEEIVLLALGFTLAMQHGRMLFVFGILAMPTVCRLLADTWRHDSDREHIVANGILLAIAAAVIAFGFPDTRNLAAQVDRAMPVRALAFIQKSGLSGPMLNDYVFGGYLIWAAPERRVLIDGRADVYEPAGVLAEYGRWATVREDPQLFLDRYGIRFCLMSLSHPMSQVIPLLPGWSTAYTDEVSAVFVRRP